MGWNRSPLQGLTFDLRPPFEPRIDPPRRGHSLGHRVHHFLTAVHTITAGKVFRIPGLMRFRVYYDAACLQLDTRDLFKNLRHGLLAEGFHHHIDFKHGVRARCDFHSRPAALAFCLCAGAG
jgi:hypothetical protein